VKGGSRQHTKIRAERERPGDISPIADFGDDAWAIRSASELGERHPAVEGREREIDHDGVEGLAIEARQGVGTVGGHGQLDIFDVDCRLNRQHARDHCHSSMSRTAGHPCPTLSQSAGVGVPEPEVRAKNVL
jgi:hypothetical protein